MEFFRVRQFLERIRKDLRFGEYSREDLKLLRIQWTSGKVECDWLMRRPDAWDRDIPAHAAKENQTLQALRDALDLRNAIFRSFPDANTAELRMFDCGQTGEFELVMSGSLTRENEIYHRIPSVAMRARLCGFQFTLAEGVLERRSQSGQSAA